MFSYPGIFFFYIEKVQNRMKNVLEYLVLSYFGMLKHCSTGKNLKS